MRPRAVAAAGRTVRFADGSELEVDARGLGDGLPARPLVDRRAGPRRRRSLAPSPRRHRVPGLYFLGLSWQHTRGSALLGFVADDAAFIAGQSPATAEPSARKSTDTAPQAAGATEGAI